MQPLIDRLGPGKVSVSPQTLRVFSEDYTELPAHAPDAVVFAENAEDVRAVLAFARETKTPVVPVVMNSNVGGLAIPEKGGIVLEMKRMNRILEVNEADQYALLEPGVTWAQLKEKLDRDHPSLRFGYTLSPPDTSVLANCLLDGLTNLSLRHGATGEWINGVEAVLSTGETVRTGIAALGPLWCSRAPMPDLTGLFLNFQGTTGIVTKLAVQLWPRRRFRRRLFVPFHDPAEAIGFLRRMAREEIMDDLGGISWPLAKRIFGIERPRERDAAEPEIYALLDFSSNWSDDLEHKHELAKRVLAEYPSREEGMDVEELVALLPEFRQFSELPTRLSFLLDHKGGGLTWVGSYGPTSKWVEGYAAARLAMERAGFPPSTVLRPMRGGHYGVLRMITTFDKGDAAEVAAVARMNAAICDAIVPLGFVPYKTPAWVVRRYESRLDPGFREVLRRVKDMMDPHHILNPGRWMLE